MRPELWTIRGLSMLFKMDLTNSDISSEFMVKGVVNTLLCVENGVMLDVPVTMSTGTNFDAVEFEATCNKEMAADDLGFKVAGTDAVVLKDGLKANMVGLWRKDTPGANARVKFGATVQITAKTQGTKIQANIVATGLNYRNIPVDAPNYDLTVQMNFNTNPDGGSASWLDALGLRNFAINNLNARVGIGFDGARKGVKHFSWKEVLLVYKKSGCLLYTSPSPRDS